MTKRPLAPLPRRRFLGRLFTVLAGAAGASLPWPVRRSEANTQGTQPYLGEIMLVPFNYAPRGWALCNGQLLSISQNQALFSLLGTTYGGNGVTTFALPDLRARLPIHQGQGPGLTDRIIGERSGELGHTLSLSEMPVHTHTGRASSAAGTSADPSSALVPARNAAQIPAWSGGTDAVMGSGAVSSTGGSQPHSNTQPFLVLNYVIALQGIFPSP